MTFGMPLRPDSGERAPRFAARIEQAVNALADEVSTDWYSARKRAHAGSSSTLTGPEAGIWRRQWALESPRRTTSTRSPRRPDL